MKLKNLFPMILAGAGIFAMTLGSGCKKENESTDEDFSAEAQDISQSEDISTSIDNMIAEAFISNSGSVDGRSSFPSNSDLSGCVTVTRDTPNSTITIHFDHCVGRNGHMRDGYIIITYSGGNYWTMGAQWDVTFDDFYIDDMAVTGSRHVENMGPESNGCTWNIDANLVFTRSNASVRTWSSTRTREIIEGYGDNNCSNHVYKINGTASHSDRQNDKSADLTFNDIIRDLDCAYLTSGTITVIRNNSRPQLVIDFGNGDCDDLATVTRNGRTRTIHLDGGRH